MVFIFGKDLSGISYETIRLLFAFLKKDGTIDTVFCQ